MNLFTSEESEEQKVKGRGADEQHAGLNVGLFCLPVLFRERARSHARRATEQGRNPNKRRSPIGGSWVEQNLQNLQDQFLSDGFCSKLGLKVGT